MTNEIRMQAFGVISGDCETLKLTRGERIKSVQMEYTDEGVSELIFVSEGGWLDVGKATPFDEYRRFEFN